MCDTTRHDSMRHDRTDDFLVWCHTYHDTTMRLDNDLLQTPWQFGIVQLITSLFHKRIIVLQIKIRERKNRNLSTQPGLFAGFLNFLS